jgi:hypothetical protein
MSQKKMIQTGVGRHNEERKQVIGRGIKEVRL